MNNLLNGKVWKRFLQLKAEEIHNWWSESVLFELRNIPGTVLAATGAAFLFFTIPVETGYLISLVENPDYVEMFKDSDTAPLHGVTSLWWLIGLTFWMVLGFTALVLSGLYKLTARICRILTGNWRKAVRKENPKEETES